MPRWTQLHGEGSVNTAEAAFAAGAALLALDRIVRADPSWLGAFRMRQALLAAEASARLLHLREDSSVLRDAHHLTRPGDDPGPAGRLHRAWRELARGPARPDAERVDRLARDLGLTVPPETFERIAVTGSGDPLTAAARAASDVVATIPPARYAEGEVLALMLADVILGHRLGWPVPVPLLPTALLHPAVKRGPGHRPRPGDEGWAPLCAMAYVRAAREAYARALDLSRRAETLGAASTQVRTRGGGEGIAALLGDDAVAAVSLKGLGSDRAARRFLERLAALGAVRELTGRSAFRLYGL